MKDRLNSANVLFRWGWDPSRLGVNCKKSFYSFLSSQNSFLKIFCIKKCRWYQRAFLLSCYLNRNFIVIHVYDIKAEYLRQKHMSFSHYHQFATKVREFCQIISASYNNFWQLGCQAAPLFVRLILGMVQSFHNTLIDLFFVWKSTYQISASYLA